MTTTAKLRRAGITLTEVLVALFIMAIGMIALLVMFPLGAQQIAQAIKDERSAQAANNADNILREHWREYVINFLKNGGTEEELVKPSSAFCLHYMTAMEDPNAVVNGDITPPAVFPNRSSDMPSLSSPGKWETLPANMSKPSYPVIISPYGEKARRSGVFASSRRWVGGVFQDASGNAVAINPANGPTRIPRRTLNFPTLSPVVYESQNLNWQFRMCTLSDDIDFDDDGRGDQGGSVTRSGRYNWDWVVQRPTQGNRLTMNLSVIVYDQRPYGNVQADQEQVYNTMVSVNETRIALPYNAAAPNPITPNVPSIRTGQWIMDGTLAVIGTNTIHNANFYRVTAVTDDPTNSQMILDLQTPIKQPDGTSFATLPAYPAQIYVLRGVAEVIERRPLTNEDTPIVP